MTYELTGPALRALAEGRDPQGPAPPATRRSPRRCAPLLAAEPGVAGAHLAPGGRTPTARSALVLAGRADPQAAPRRLAARAGRRRDAARPAGAGPGPGAAAGRQPAARTRLLPPFLTTPIGSPGSAPGRTRTDTQVEVEDPRPAGGCHVDPGAEQRPLLASSWERCCWSSSRSDAAVLSGEYIGTLGIALAFGFTLLALAYALGPISGRHVNPAVTLGMFVARRIDLPHGRRVLDRAARRRHRGRRAALPGGQAGPGAGDQRRLRHQRLRRPLGGADRPGGAFVAEIVLTFLLVYVWLAVTHGSPWPASPGLPHRHGARGGPPGRHPADRHVGEPGAQPRPARSSPGGAALTQLWLFIVAPLVGGLAAVVHRATHPPTGASACTRRPASRRARQPAEPDGPAGSA